MNIVRSAWRFEERHGGVKSLLRSLGIDFRPGGDFWESNAHILPEIWEELKSEARERLHELHPDKGGNAREFDAFIQVWDKVRKQFRRYTPVQSATASTVIDVMQKPTQSGTPRRRARGVGLTPHLMRLRYLDQRKAEYNRYKRDPEWRKLQKKRLDKWRADNPEKRQQQRIREVRNLAERKRNSLEKRTRQAPAGAIA